MIGSTALVASECSSPLKWSCRKFEVSNFCGISFLGYWKLLVSWQLSATSILWANHTRRSKGRCSFWQYGKEVCHWMQMWLREPVKCLSWKTCHCHHTGYLWQDPWQDPERLNTAKWNTTTKLGISHDCVQNNLQMNKACWVSKLLWPDDKLIWHNMPSQYAQGAKHCRVGWRREGCWMPRGPVVRCGKLSASAG